MRKIPLIKYNYKLNSLSLDVILLLTIFMAIFFLAFSLLFMKWIIKKIPLCFFIKNKIKIKMAKRQRRRRLRDDFCDNFVQMFFTRWYLIFKKVRSDRNSTRFIRKEVSIELAWWQNCGEENQIYDSRPSIPIV